MINYATKTNTGSMFWKRQLEELREARQSLNDSWQSATELERQLATKRYHQLQAGYEPSILNGSLAEWNAAADRAGDAIGAVMDAKAAEVRSWDASALSSEMDVIEKRIQLLINSGSGSDMGDDPTISKLKAIYDENINCGSRERERATGEVFSGLLGFVHSGGVLDRAPFNALQAQAKYDLAEIRHTAAIDTSEDSARLAINGLNAAKGKLQDVDSLLGYNRFGGSEIGCSQIYTAITSRVEADNIGNVIKVNPREGSK